MRSSIYPIPVDGDSAGGTVGLSSSIATFGRPPAGSREAPAAGDIARQDIVTPDLGFCACMNLRHYLHRQIISGSTGRRLGRVEEILIDSANGQVVGFRLRHGGLLDRRWRFVALVDVIFMDSHDIVIAHALALREDEQTGGRIRLRPRGMAVFDESGSRLGRVEDAKGTAVPRSVEALLVAPVSGRRRVNTHSIVVPISAIHVGKGDVLVVRP